MTLIFERSVENRPAMHAFILGCGRFPNLGASAARQATVAGARKVVRYLVDHRDEMIAHLASIECLLSDPDVVQQEDRLALGPLAGDERKEEDRADDSVDPVTQARVESAGEEWLKRCRPGDHLFFYMASHGVADKNFSAAGLFEDVLSSRFKKWGASLNVNALALNLPATGAGACWLFLDACQELIADVLGQYNGTSGVTLIDASAADIANATVQSLGLAGSRFGKSAWAPDATEPPFFTQALLEAFQSCIDTSRIDDSWVVTGEKLQHNIPNIAVATFGYEMLEVAALSPFSTSLEFARVDDPQVPVLLRTTDIADMADMLHVVIQDKLGGDADTGLTIEPKATCCFARLRPDRKYLASPTFRAPTANPYAPLDFTARACGQVLTFKS